MKKLLIIVMLISNSVMADDDIKNDDSLLTFRTISPNPNAMLVEIFRLGSGGCLRGPLRLMDQDGNIKFELKHGVEYPSGCLENKK
jgi:hypothetical protein